MEKRAYQYHAPPMQPAFGPALLRQPGDENMYLHKQEDLNTVTIEYGKESDKETVHIYNIYNPPTGGQSTIPLLGEILQKNMGATI
jgi:hypothetical protein